MSLYPKYFCYTILKAVGAQNVALRLVEVEQEVYVGDGCVVTAGHGTEESQMQEAGGLEFRFVLAESGEDAFLIHGESL